MMGTQCNRLARQLVIQSGVFCREGLVILGAHKLQCPSPLNAAALQKLMRQLPVLE